MSEELHDHDRGLSFDLPTLHRRKMIRLLAGVGLVPLVGCSSDDSDSSASSSSSRFLFLRRLLRERRVRDHPRRDGRPVPR